MDKKFAPSGESLKRRMQEFEIMNDILSSAGPVCNTSLQAYLPSCVIYSY